jgi:acetyl-CoA carboxylase carboxyl transferase subunit alpha
MLEHGLIDGIIPEPLGGAHRNPTETFDTVKKYILNAYNEIKDLDTEERINLRIQKYASMGKVEEIVDKEIQNEIIKD